MIRAPDAHLPSNQTQSPLHHPAPFPCSQNDSPSMHYREVKKLVSKWPTLLNYFSTDFCTKDAQFLTELSKLPKNLKKEKRKIEEAKQIQKPVANTW